MSSADIGDPESIRIFRFQLAKFLQVCATALSGSDTELSKVSDWLRVEQQAHWKKQIRIREEAYQEARRVWLVAENDVKYGHSSRGPAKHSSIDERVLMEKARRKREEAEERLALVRKWMLKVEQDGAPLVHQCTDQDLALRDLGGKALAQLDRLSAALATYHARAPRT